MKLTLRALFCSSVVATAACLPLQAQERTITVRLSRQPHFRLGIRQCGTVWPRGSELGWRFVHGDNND